MPRLEYFLVSTSASLDGATGRVSIFEVLTEIRTPRVPAVLGRCVSVACWAMDEKELNKDYQATIVLKRPGASTEKYKANFRASERYQHVLHEFSGMPIRGIGTLTFEVELDGTHAASHTILIHQSVESDLPDAALLPGIFKSNEDASLKMEPPSNRGAG
jgi:hypothetical protein